ncbi:TRAP transporter large permease [Clostridium estertheticum]|uniref:TRAP transporter large permease n=1 Tax=Clostridium estertheticum TaxID=238834 RepID=UPI001C0E6253|nr:TRAP transporter large permease [Clostridium estertheticum]MBU3217014.1 TRAP transporter large permease [Clostridium estertheticum]WAG56121.1 TRAP transporter large permease [Clostridium estertheticum]
MDTNTIAIIILLGVFFGLLLVKVPITFSLGLSAVTTAIFLQIPLMSIVQQIAKGISSFSLITIPFFILAGEIMGQGGISTRLVNFSRVIVGRIRGGLAMVDVLACLFFGGLSGSSVADTTSIGSIMIPMMEKEGYDKDFAVCVTVASATQGVLVPPSHNLILFSLAAGGVSISSLFLAGIVPGIFLGLSVMIFSYFMAVKRKYPVSAKIPFKKKLYMLKDGILGLFTAVIIMGGIMTGICTATESAALATVYAFIITFFVYKDVPLSKMGDILRKSLKTISMVMGLIAASAAFGWMIAMVQLPELVTNALIAVSDNRVVIFLLINLILLGLGMIMDMAPLILIATPILLPVVVKFGMDPIQFGIILMLNLGIGLLTPPVGSTLFVGCSIGNISIEKVTKALFPFYGVMIAVLLVLTFVPGLSLMLPHMFS